MNPIPADVPQAVAGHHRAKIEKAFANALDACVAQRNYVAAEVWLRPENQKAFEYPTISPRLRLTCSCAVRSRATGSPVARRMPTHAWR